MRVLVTGVMGFIGGFLSRRLMDSGAEVSGFDLHPVPRASGLCRHVAGTILDPEAIFRATEGVDTIVHLIAAHQDFGVSRDEFFNINARGTENLLDAATRRGIERLVFYSSVAVYGDGHAYTTEKTPPSPASDYGASKLAAEQIIRRWASVDPGRQAVIIRPTVVFGPDNYANMYNLINSIHRNRFVFVGRGENIKSVAYVENLVEATAFLLQRIRPGVAVYNYSDYPQMTTAEIVSMINDCLKRNAPRIRLPLKPTLALAGVFDLLGQATGYNFPITANRIRKFNKSSFHRAEKIRDEGYRALVDLPEGFKKTVEWYLREGQRGLDQRSNAA